MKKEVIVAKFSEKFFFIIKAKHNPNINVLARLGDLTQVIVAFLDKNTTPYSSDEYVTMEILMS